MTNAIITDIENWFDELKADLSSSTVVQTVESDVSALALSGWNYIKTNGLTDVYQLALTLLTGAAAGTAWGTLMSTLVTQAEAAGKSLLAGAESIVLGQAQADLIAAGKLIAPSTGAVVAAAPTPAA